MNRLLTWLKHRAVWLLLYALVAGAISFAGNVFFLAYLNDGYGGIPKNGITLTPHTFSQGAVFWSLANVVLFALIGYWRAAGTKRFLKGVLFFPHWIGLQFAESQQWPTAFLLWGIALGLIAAAYLNIWLCLVLAILFYATAPSWVSRLAAVMVCRLWIRVKELRQKPKPKPLLLPASLSVFIIGLATAFLVVFLVEMKFPKLGFALLVGLVAFHLSWRRRPSTAGTLLLWLFGTLLLLGIDIELLLAHDGGWVENGSNFRQWVNGQGTETVIDYSRPAAPIGGGSGLIGGLGGEIVGDDPDGEELPILNLDEIMGPGVSNEVVDVEHVGPPGYRDMALGEPPADTGSRGSDASADNRTEEGSTRNDPEGQDNS